MKMFDKHRFFFLLIIAISFSPEAGSRETSKSLSRKRRYVVFPEGSSFSVALCMTVHTLTPDNIFTEGVNWGISYDLPNESKPELEPFLEFRKDKIIPSGNTNNKGDYYYNHALPINNNNNNNNYGFHGSNDWGKYQLLVPGKKKKYYKSDYHYLQRRHRRELYNKLEVIMNAMGFDGRTCILRALCEASQRLMPKGNTLVEEMMRIAFSLPLKKILSFEPQEHHAYTNAHRAGHEGRDCVAMFPGCSFSLIDLALGRYSSPNHAHPYDAVVTEEVVESTDVPANFRYNMK